MSTEDLQVRVREAPDKDAYQHRLAIWLTHVCRPSLFLAHTAACFPNDHCLMLLDGAGWHTAAALQVAPTLHMLLLPHYSRRVRSLVGVGEVGRAGWDWWGFMELKGEGKNDAQRDK